jgi:hypothetical protein
MSSELSKHTLTTLAYYDVLDYPMTSFEIWKYLTAIPNSQFPISNKIQKNNDVKFSLDDVIKELENSELKKYVEEHHGFYFLRGRKSLAEERIKRNKISEKKYRMLQKIASILRFVPFVRMMAVTGRVAMKNAEEKSDLDLLIVLKGGKIFTGRILVTLIVHLLGKRRYKGKITDRVCLNYFITTDSLEISQKDMFSSSEYYFMLLLFGEKVFREFREKNAWISEYKPNLKIEELANRRILTDIGVLRAIRGAGEILLGFDFIEKGLKSWQMKRINRNPKTHQPGSMVTAGDGALVFLPSPQGPRIWEKFQANLKDLV